MALYGPLWSDMVLLSRKVCYGHIRSCVVLYGPIWIKENIPVEPKQNSASITVGTRGNQPPPAAPPLQDQQQQDQTTL